MIHRRGPLVFAILAVLVARPIGQDQRDPLRSALAKRIDEVRQGTGTVVGLLTAEGRWFAAYGSTSVGGPEATADTIFEIGSITKVFTASLLAQMVERGEVALDDPVRKYLPASVRVPSRGGKEISLVDLATHTSGLPRDSVAVDLNSDSSPYAGYTESDLYAFLGGHRLRRDPGSRWEYSNVGMGLLGHALALRAGVSYEALLRRRIFEPLGMTNTAITFDAEQLARRATGHNRGLSPLPPWSGGVIDPAGSVNSTAADMLKFGAAVIEPQSPLAGVFARMTSVRRRHEEPRLQQALGWDLFRLGANEILGKSGTTFGFQARFIVDTTRKRVVVAWINGAGPPVTDLVGLALDGARLQ
jgi:serine-type D-Ala-D-Ala carboxypeptidase/endopeptidase